MGTIQIDGSTPKLTIGNATAEDATILFDGAAQDFYIALDDSADDLLIGLGSTVGTTPAIAIDENLKVNIPVTTASTSASTGSLTTGGGEGIGADLYVGDDVYLITDSAVLGFGADKDTTLTHTDGTGLTLNSTNKLCFNDASQFVQGSSATVLSIGATDEIDLTATAIDINGTADVSGDVTVGYQDTAPTATAMGTAHANDATLLLGGANSGATQGSLYLGGQNISADGVTGAVYGFSGGSQNAGIEFLEGSADAYGQIKMSVAQGTAGTLVEVMKIDNTGAVTKPLQPAFLAHNDGSDSITNATETTIALDTEIFDVNGDVSSNTFTAPVTGKYFLSGQVRLDAGTGANTRFNKVYIEFECSNRDARFEFGQNYTDEDDRMGVTGSIVMDMDASDTAVLRIFASRNGASDATTTRGSATDALTFFSGFLLG